MTAAQEQGHKWVDTKNYENFLKNCVQYGRSKSQWVNNGCPETKPNGEPIEDDGVRGGDEQ